MIALVNAVCQAQDTQRRPCPHPTVVGLRATRTLDCLTVTVESMEMQAVNGEGPFFFFATMLFIYSHNKWSLCAWSANKIFYQKPSNFYLPWIETEQNPRLEP